MTNPKTTRQERPSSRPESPKKEAAERQHSDRTSGTNRDFDESEKSRNQGHGHPREERGWHQG
jgi:hypothetical protein